MDIEFYFANYLADRVSRRNFAAKISPFWSSSGERCGYHLNRDIESMIVGGIASHRCGSTARIHTAAIGSTSRR
jgi:hypothetical protein